LVRLRQALERTNVLVVPRFGDWPART